MQKIQINSREIKPLNLIPGDIDFDLIQSFQERIIDDFIKKSTSAFNERIKDYLKKNLLEFGHKFENDTDFIDFVTNRIHRVSFEESPNYYEFYLDFIDADDRGKFLGSYSDNVEIINEGNEITAIMG